MQVLVAVKADCCKLLYYLLYFT